MNKNSGEQRIRATIARESAAAVTSARFTRARARGTRRHYDRIDRKDLFIGFVLTLFVAAVCWAVLR